MAVKRILRFSGGFTATCYVREMDFTTTRREEKLPVPATDIREKSNVIAYIEMDTRASSSKTERKEKKSKTSVESIGTQVSECLKPE